MRLVPKRHYRAKKDNVTVSIRIPDSLKGKLEALAEEHGRGFSDFVQEGLDQWAFLHDQRTSKIKESK
jgi:predicted transcriptional regulator